MEERRSAGCANDSSINSSGRDIARQVIAWCLLHTHLGRGEKQIWQGRTPMQHICNTMFRHIARPSRPPNDSLVRYRRRSKVALHLVPPLARHHAGNDLARSLERHHRCLCCVRVDEPCPRACGCFDLLSRLLSFASAVGDMLGGGANHGANQPTLEHDESKCACAGASKRPSRRVLLGRPDGSPSLPLRVAPQPCFPACRLPPSRTLAIGPSCGGPWRTPTHRCNPSRRP